MMKTGQRVRVIMLFMTMLMLVSPLASAQSTPVAEETPVVVETPEGTGETPVVEETPDAPTPTDEVMPTEEVVDEVTPEPTEVVDESTPDATETETATDTVDVPDDVLPASTPGEQMQSRGISLQAATLLEVTVVTPDGQPVPAGIEVYVYNSQEWSQGWDSRVGDSLTFTMDSTRSDYYVYVPIGSDYVGMDGNVSVTSGQTTALTFTLLKKGTVEVSLAPDAVPDGTEVCVWWSDENCQTWIGDALTFAVEPGDVTYRVTPPAGSGFAIAAGSFTVGAGETIQQTFTLEVPATVNVTVITADGGPMPDWVDVDIYPSFERWQAWEGDALTFTVTPGEVRYEVDLLWNSRYQETSGTIAVSPGDSVDLTIELQPKGPGILRVYVTTDDGGAVPDGTQVCVDMLAPEVGEPVENLCQTTSGSYVSFTLDRGDVDITVTPPVGSGYLGETSTHWVELGETARVVFELERTEPLPTGVVEINVSTADGAPLTEFGISHCLFLGEFWIFSDCIWDYDVTEEADGSVTFTYAPPAGTYNHIVFSSLPGYGAISGTVTVAADETVHIDVVLPVLGDQDRATLIVDVVTADGSPVADGVMVCALDLGSPIEDGDDPEEACRLWTGTPESFTLSPTLAIYLASDDGFYYLPSFPEVVFLSPGETRNVTITLYPYDLEPTMSKTVSDEVVHSGDTVSYTLRAYGGGGIQTFAYEPGFDFEITDVLPVELSDITVSCAGTFTQVFPGPCYELENGVLTVLGDVGMMGVYDITITVTGTVTGAPGTIVSNTACLDQGMSMPDLTSTDVNKIASTNLYGLALQEGPGGDVLCDTAVLTIVAQDVTPTPAPTETATPVTPEPTETATPAPTGTPDVSPSPTATATITPDVTPTTLAGEPTATPAGAPVVTTLPSTGSGAGQAMVLYATAIAALSLMAAGGALHLRSRNR